MSTWLVDVGNSRCKVAPTRDGELGAVSVVAHDDSTALIADLATAGSPPDRVFLASVAPSAVTERLLAAFGAQPTLALTRVASGDCFPSIVSGYRKPEQLGVDRLLAMVAARAERQGPLCVVDAGTAVTVDFVDQDGMHQGGFILPGLAMSRRCLLENTAIPRDDDVERGATLGRDTATGVALGALNAIVGLVERFTVGRAALFRGEETAVVVGGGDADVLADLLPMPCIKLDHLVLRGLAAYAASKGA